MDKQKESLKVLNNAIKRMYQEEGINDISKITEEMTKKINKKLLTFEEVRELKKLGFWEEENKQED